MKRSSVALGLALLLTSCAAVDRPDASNLAAFCTPQNAERLGAEGRAYFGGCPKTSEDAILAGLERGRALASTPAVWPFYAQMHQTELMLVAAASDADRERLRGQLREYESWSVRILNNPGTYSVSP
jgi:hypothetical protein